MKVVILCGGKGTRLAEETKIRPKSMVNIGNKPILSHIIELFTSQGFSDFILALGYKGDVIKKYYKNKKNILMVDTGKNSLTGGRILKLSKFLKNERFFLTYGDGLADINLNRLLKFHISHKKMATITAVRPPARFGELMLQNNRLKIFPIPKSSDTGDKVWFEYYVRDDLTSTTRSFTAYKVSDPRLSSSSSPIISTNLSKIKPTSLLLINA